MRLTLWGAAVALPLFGGVFAAHASDDIDDLLVDGKFTFDARVRVERVDQEGFAERAVAPTARARVGFVTGKVSDFQGLIEAEAVVHLGDRFNDTVNGNTTYPVIPDPDGIELNRLQVEYSGLPQTVLTLGRQRINLDNQRFVGAGAWRQNEQTFDALRVVNTSIDGLALTYVFVNQVNRIFGNESLQGEFDEPSHFFNAAYELPPIGKIVGYAYLVDIDVASMRNQASASYGLRVTGKKDVGGGYALGYEAEYAHQNDYGHNPNDLSLSYWHGDLSIAHSGLQALIGVESLEGSGVGGVPGFSTPLGTLHKFQGYADVFLNTPSNGIVDVYGKVGYEQKLSEPFGPITGFTAAAWYHDFDAERGGQSLGSEIDLEAAAKFGDHFTVGAKYADYDGDGGFAGRQKIWLYVDAIY
jgi:hypothetical protein